LWAAASRTGGLLGEWSRERSTTTPGASWCCGLQRDHGNRFAAQFTRAARGRGASAVFGFCCALSVADAVPCRTSRLRIIRPLHVGFRRLQPRR
ncbi:unnamed protein product, partial [Amoebophrya sp. A25]